MRLVGLGRLGRERLTANIAVPEAEKFDGFLSVSEGIPWLITKRDLGFSHDFTPTPPSTLSLGVSAVPPSHRNPGKYAGSARARSRRLRFARPEQSSKPNSSTF